MAICAADMKSCKKKKKCLFGPNEGKAYDAKDPCCGRGEFSPETCDCLPLTGWSSVRAEWSIHLRGTGYYSDQDVYTKPGWYNGSQRHEFHMAYYRYAYIHSAFFSSNVACAGCNYTAENNNGVFQAEYTISDSGTGLIGLENDTERRQCIWAEYCKIKNYTCRDYTEGKRGCTTYTVTGYIIGMRDEFDPEQGETVRKSYRLFDNLDLNDPYKGPDYIASGVADIPMFEGENVGSFMSSDCECIGYGNPGNSQ